MPWFKCSICGEDFPGAILSQADDIGFYVTRFVEAASPEEAELVALADLKSDEKLRLPSGIEAPAKARVDFEEIVEIERTDVPSIQPGFVFFAMGS